MKNSLIFLLISLSTTCSELAIQSPLEELVQRNRACGKDFKNQDLSALDFTGFCLKGSDFTGAKLPVLDTLSFDWYCAKFDAAKIPNYQEIKQKFSTFGLQGRIDQLLVDGVLIDCSTLTAETADAIFRYRQSAWKPSSKFILAYLYETFGTKEEEESAFILYKQALAEGIIEAANNLGWLCEHNRGTSHKTREQALNYYKKAGSLAKAQFNNARLDAACLENPESFYLAAKLLLKGEAIKADEERAYYYFLAAAVRNHARAMHKVGCYLKSGIPPVARDLPQAIQWLEKSDHAGGVESAVLLGDIHYHGEGGIAKDPIKAYSYRKKGAANGNVQALKDLAWMTERGEGTARNPEEALRLYSRIAKTEKSVSAYYACGRLCDELKKDQEAAGWYEKTLERTRERLEAKDSHGGREHVGALYRLAIKYQKGIGVPSNPAKAIELLSRAAKMGHLASRIKLHLLQRPDALLPFDTIDALSPEVQALYLTQSNRLMAEVDAEYPIQMRDLNFLFSRFMQAPVFETIELFNLTTDYRNALTVLKAVADEHMDDPVQVNYAFISCDPFLKYAYQDPAEKIADEQVSTQKIEELFDELVEAARVHPAYEDSMDAGLMGIKSRLLSEQFEKIKMVRKKLLYRYQKWTTPPAGQGWTDQELLEKKGWAAIQLVQNDNRCADGLAGYLAELEIEDLFGITDAALPLGARLSKVIQKYKHDFLKWHETADPSAVEEKVEAMALLFERMRLILGLPGTFTPPLYPGLGRGDSEVYDPVQVTTRFLRGGQIPQRPLVAAIQPYTAQLQIELIKNVVYDPDNHIIDLSHINALHDHPKFKKAFEQAFVTDEVANEYFDPFAENGAVFTDAFFQELLLMHGFQIRKSRGA